MDGRSFGGRPCRSRHPRWGRRAGPAFTSASPPSRSMSFSPPWCGLRCGFMRQQLKEPVNLLAVPVRRSELLGREDTWLAGAAVGAAQRSLAPSGTVLPVRAERATPPERGPRGQSPLQWGNPTSQRHQMLEATAAPAGTQRFCRKRSPWGNNGAEDRLRGRGRSRVGRRRGGLHAGALASRRDDRAADQQRRAWRPQAGGGVPHPPCGAVTVHTERPQG